MVKAHANPKTQAWAWQELNALPESAIRDDQPVAKTK